ncbi:MAG: tRNA-intron lyase [Nanoarchaeota archaeon]
MPKEKIQAHLIGEIVSSNDSEAFNLFDKSCFGERVREKIQYSYSEALFLLENKKIQVFFGKKELGFDELFKKIKRFDNKIQTKYPVFKDLREKGYVVKTALKFGAEFRVYDKGSKPGQKHAKWIVFTDFETKKFSWHEFSSKNRIANSTKKKLLLAIVDDESDVSYYEVGWVKP